MSTKRNLKLYGLLVFLLVVGMVGFASNSSDHSDNKSEEVPIENSRTKPGIFQEVGTSEVIDKRSGEVVDISEPSKTISEDETPEYDHQVVSIEGKIQYSFDSRKQTVLAFHPHHRGYFKVLIKEQYYPKFTDTPDTIYTIGTKIKVTGLLEWYQGDQTIFVTDPEHIEILD